MQNMILFSTCVIIANCGKQSPIKYEEADGVIYFENKAIKLTINKEMKIKTFYQNGDNLQSLVSDQSAPNDYVVVGGNEINNFQLENFHLIDVKNEFGIGKQLTISGENLASGGNQTIRIKKVLKIELYDRFPNAAVTSVEYTNLSDNPINIDKVISSSYIVDRKLLDPTKNSYDFSLFQGCGVDWGIDYCNIKVDSNYSAVNFMGIVEANRDPKGGGIPLLDLWGKEMGMAIAHISPKPEFINFPIQTLSDGKVKYSIEEKYSKEYNPIRLAKGEKFSTIKHVVIVHSLDYFDALRTYAQFLNCEGIKTFKETPETVPQAYWKTWGYELDFKLSDIYSKIAEFKELGIEMIVLDDGWFSNYGDWEPHTGIYKFPQGRKSLKKFIDDMHKENLKVGIWWSPLIAEPHSEVAKANPDWFMHQKDGKPYIMKEPDSYFLCPDYEPVLKFWEEQIEKLYITFDLDFIYHDWANLIEVPPCYNSAHKHESPLAPYWNMSDQYKLMYEKVQTIKPGYAVEMCECGRPHDPYKMPYYNISNASDANSKEQVRNRLKVEKALNGSKSYFNPGYVLPEKPNEDWNYDPCDIDECVAMGGFFETYYTELSPAKKIEWSSWLKIYRDEKIYQGEYLNLYDIEFDEPDVHVTKNNGIYYYFAPGPFEGEFEIRGLESRTYMVNDLYSKDSISIVEGPVAKINLKRDGNIYLKVEAEN